MSGGGRGKCLKRVKRRPAVVVSSDTYHAHCPDIVVCLLTTQLAPATTLMDYILQDWADAGLYAPSAFRVYVDDIRLDGLSVNGWLNCKGTRKSC
jgi:hypothetical protein